MPVQLSHVSNLFAHRYSIVTLMIYEWAHLCMDLTHWIAVIGANRFTKR